MKVLSVRNVNEALQAGVNLLRYGGQKVTPRGIPTLEFPMPVITVYDFPQECVLFHPLRDANPFFHLFEALWILAGRNDVEFLARFNRRMAEFSDDGETFHAAYGHRLRSFFHTGEYRYMDRSVPVLDQLVEAVKVIRQDPDSRQAVLQIWDAPSDLNFKSKDIPCNDLVFVKLREGKLNMTVCCRSNDMIWGAYGTNAVQFSFVQQWLAGALGVEVGTLRQVSDSFHVYDERPDWEKLRDALPSPDPYALATVRPMPLMKGHYTVFDEDVRAFCDDPGGDAPLREDFLWLVARPLYQLWEAHSAWIHAGRPLSVPRPLDRWPEFIRPEVNDVDWVQACRAWLERREQVYGNE